MGYAAAMAVLLFIVSFAFTALLVQRLRRGAAGEAES
jgi:multiple sugar transport system permease protein